MKQSDSSMLTVVMWDSMNVSVKRSIVWRQTWAREIEQNPKQWPVTAHGDGQVPYFLCIFTMPCVFVDSKKGETYQIFYSMTDSYFQRQIKECI